MKNSKKVSCANCNKTFITFYAHKKYCSSSCKSKAYRKRHPYRVSSPYCPSYQQRMRKKYRDAWGNVGWIRSNHELVQKAESLVANILPKEGFSDVLSMRGVDTNFPFDIMAKKDGNLCAVEVTLQYEKKFRREILPLIELLNLRVFVCFVKPDFSTYILEEMPMGKHYVSIKGKIRPLLSVPMDN
jgi:hypothetical protein